MKKIILLAGVIFSSILAFAGDKPSFPGGDSALQAYLSKNTRYPSISQENGVEGIVTVGFVVSPDGSINQIKILKFIDPDLEKEALRVVAGMPAWIPAEINGVAVEAAAQVEVPFIME